MASKTKPNLSDTSNAKVKPSVTGVAKVNRVAKPAASSPSSLQNSRLSIDRSPKSVNSGSPKTPIDRRSPKVTTSHEKQHSRTPKGSELQARLNLAEEDLKKAKEQVSILEKEKLEAVQELKEAHKLAEEANEKLSEALAAHRRAEESTEVEKFRVVEIEQAGIEEVQKREKEWQKELDSLRKQHNLDLLRLQSAEDGLKSVKQEMAVISDAKNGALRSADEATQAAEIHAQKVEILSAEIAHFKTLLDSSVAMEASEKQRIEVEMNLQVESLQRELREAKALERKLIERDGYITELRTELKDYRISESDSQHSLLQLRNKIEELEGQVQTGSETFNSVMNKLENKNEELHNTHMEIASLNDKIDLLEACITEKEDEIVKSQDVLQAAKEEASDSITSVMKQIESKNEAICNAQIEISSLKDKISLLGICITEKEDEVVKLHSLIQAAKDEASEYFNSLTKQLDSKNEALNNTQIEVASLKDKIEHLQKHISEKEGEIVKSHTFLQAAKEEVSYLTNFVESVRAEVESLKEEKSINEKHTSDIIQKLTEEKDDAITHLENSNKEAEKRKKTMEDLASALLEISTEANELKEQLENSKSQLENLNAENQNYKTTLHESQLEFHKAKTGSEQREMDLMNKMRGLGEENSSMGKEVSNLLNLLKAAEADSRALKEELDQLKNRLKKTESETTFMKEGIESEKAENMRIKNDLLQKEKHLQTIVQENEELRVREASAHKRAEELAKLLEESNSKKSLSENNELIDAEKDYDLLPKAMEFSDLPHQNNDKSVDEEKTPKFERKRDDSTEGDLKMWETCKIGDKDFSPEREQKVALSSEDDRTERSSLSGDIYGSANPSTKLLEHKKKKPLLQKFGSLLKKRSAANHKS